MKQKPEPDWSGENDGFSKKSDLTFHEQGDNWFVRCDQAIEHLTTCALYLSHTPKTRGLLMGEAFNLIQTKSARELTKINQEKWDYLISTTLRIK